WYKISERKTKQQSSPNRTAELSQFLFVQIGDEAIVQSLCFAVDDGITATIFKCPFPIFSVRRGPDEDIDAMFVAPIHQRRDGATVQIIQSPANQWKAFCSEVLHVRGEVHFAVEPRLDGMLITGGNIGEMLGHERAHVAGDGFVQHLVAPRNSLRSR